MYSPFWVQEGYASSWIQCITTTPKTNYTLLYFFTIPHHLNINTFDYKVLEWIETKYLASRFYSGCPMFHIKFYNSCLLNGWSYKQLSIKNAFWPRYFKHLWNAWHRLAVFKYGNRLNQFFSCCLGSKAHNILRPEDLVYWSTKWKRW